MSGRGASDNPAGQRLQSFFHICSCDTRHLKGLPYFLGARRVRSLLTVRVTNAGSTEIMGFVQLRQPDAKEEAQPITQIN
jgi:hypothetical protein